MSPRTPFWLPADDPEYPFPPDDLALRDPNGLLAIGGDLTPRRLLSAYRQGIFPWYSDDQPILWWTPDPRSVLFPADLKVSRSLRKRVRNGPFRVTFDRAFREVVNGCAAPRPGESGTWITDEMREAYCRLHELGYAHSAEAWFGEELVGGLYGVAIGRVFYGESMFARRTDASKVAFVRLVRFLERRGFGVIDCQVATAHLRSLGAVDIPRKTFRQLLARHCDLPPVEGPWQPDPEETAGD